MIYSKLNTYFLVSAKVKILETGSKIITEVNSMKPFQLNCQLNVIVYSYSNLRIIAAGFLKDGNNISSSDSRYKIINSNAESLNEFINYYLKFDLQNIDVNEFKGNYSCYIALASIDLQQTKTYTSDTVFVEFNKIIKPKYDKSVGSLILPKLHSIVLKIACKLTAYPLAKIEWSKENENINQSYTSSYVLSKNSTVVKNLYIPLNKVEKDSQYKCITNDSLTINDLKVTIAGKFLKIFQFRFKLDLVLINIFNFLDTASVLDVKLDDSSSNSLKVRFKLQIKSNSENQIYNDYAKNPVKYRITYTRLPNVNNSLIFDGFSK